MPIGNITAGQTVVIRITYITELKHNAETESIRFVFPTIIAPRYGSSDYTPANDRKKLTPDVIHYTEKTYYYLNLLNPDVSKITLAKQITHLEKDLILVAKSLDLDQQRAIVEYDPKTETNCITLTLVPKYTINEIKSELIFVWFDARQTIKKFDSLFEKCKPYSERSILKALKHAQEMVAN
ncbi:43505_t:CDS:2 [Gigaspora margarita]|uniref:43505_t:CDS:1 n=1 Tax=Gigaspora margarita TaxID=4874 RepID=A0ABN7W8H9_GIGMA|nr:43505_t:CDS:2 [Gigaspora margarita]